MSICEQGTRQSIIDVAKDILDEVDDVEKITIRQIAERAKVGTGLINYHFKSKDNLLSIALGDIMTKTIRHFSEKDSYSDLGTKIKLKMMVKQLYDLANIKQKIMHFVLSREIMEGNMQTPLYLIPLLKDIFGSKKDDMQLRIIALQIIHPIQVTALNTDTFHMYSGIDLTKNEERNLFIDTLIDNLVD